MNRRLKWLTYVLVIFLILGLFFVACGRNHRVSDLEHYITTLKQQHQNQRKQKRPLLKTIPPVQYTAAKVRPPFGETAKITSVQNPKEIEANPLLGYSLAVLRFVGTVMQGEVIHAYILAPDNKVYQVKLSDEVGDRHGKVTLIEANRLQITEGSPGEPKGQSTTTLELKDTQ